MSTWGFYRLSDGCFTGKTANCTADKVAAHTPAGCAAMEGVFDHLSQRVNLATGQVEDYQPARPADDALRTWDWDGATRRWVVTPTLHANRLRRLYPVQQAIDAQEARQSLRPMREAFIEIFAGRAVPPETKARLAEIDAAIAPLRAKAQAILAAATQQDLDAIP